MKLLIPAAAALALAYAGAANAGPTYSFVTSTGVQPSNVGTILLTQLNSTTVEVDVKLKDTTYGFLNTGGPHTPFAFNIAGTETGIGATFILPAAGIYSFGVFTLSTNNGDAAPFGTFGISINNSAGNGSDKAHYGGLKFDVSRASGLSTDDFIANGSGAFFAADLTNGSAAGSQAWQARISGDVITQIAAEPVPEPASMALLGAGLLGLGAIARRRRS